RGSAQQQGSPAEEATPAPAAEPNTPTESSNEKQTTKPAEEPRVHPVGDEVIIKARQQEKNGNVFTLSGEGEVSYRDTVLRADEIVYDQSTGDVKANGHVVVEGGTHQEHIEGTSAEYNVRTETGKFYNAQGTVGLLKGSRHAQLTTQNPFAVSG